MQRELQAQNMRLAAFHFIKKSRTKASTTGHIPDRLPRFNALHRPSDSLQQSPRHKQIKKNMDKGHAVQRQNGLRERVTYFYKLKTNKKYLQTPCSRICRLYWI